MSVLDNLLIASLCLIPASWLLANWFTGRVLLTVAYAALLYVLIDLPYEGLVSSSFQPQVLGQQMLWQMDAFGSFFAMLTVAAAFFSSWYASGSWAASFADKGGSLKLLYAALALNVFVMLLLITAADFMSLFISWELVSWSGVLLMLLGGRDTVAPAIKYIAYVFAGGMAVLAAVILLAVWTGNLSFFAVAAAIGDLSSAQLWTVTLLFFAGFAVKMGLLPFHLWQAPAYAMTAGPASVFLSAMSARMGLLAIIVVLMRVFGIEFLDKLQVINQWLSLRDLLAWLAALTIILPTYTALRQNDARLLLAWHGIGQGGYMLLGLLMLDSLGTAGGLMHVFNYALYQAALVMSVFAIMKQTGTTDLNRLGGLVARMPLTFLVMLVCIIGLAGLPPMNGFVSKWMIYRALVNEGMPMLFVASVIGTLGTILSVYKLLHNSFLGQLRAEHQHISEVSWSMMLPMLLLAALVLLTGMMPGLVLEWIAAAQIAAGFEPVQYTLGGVMVVNAAVSGDLDMLWVSGILFAGFAVGAVLFLSAGKSKRVHQLDNYAGGHFLTADNQYHYSDNFYAGLMNIIKPWYRGSFVWFEKGLVSFVDLLASFAGRFYSLNQTTGWMVAFSVIFSSWLIFF